MTSHHFSAEIFDLFALGVLEDPEAEQLREHLRGGCRDCTEALRESLTRVTEMALFLPALEPPRRVRARIVNTVRPRIRVWRTWFLPTGLAVGAASLALVLGVGAGWVAGVRLRSAAPESLALRQSPPPVPSVVIPAAPSTAPPQPMALGSDADANLAESNRELARQLVQARDRTAKLQATVRERENELAAAQEKLDDELAKYTAAAPDRETAQAADRRIAALESRLAELSRQLEFYKASSERQRGELNRNVQLIALLNAPDLSVVYLKATERGGTASARALVSRNGNSLFIASELPTLPSGRTYQLWLMRRAAPAIVSGGVFHPDGAKGASIQVRSPQFLTALTGMAVTEEPEGGSPLPTGHKILIGLAKS